MKFNAERVRGGFVVLIHKLSESKDPVISKENKKEEEALPLEWEAQRLVCAYVNMCSLAVC